ncbi:hypothetical protein [Caldimonas tepidiphila]|uniref:hypothetical protein n=1 Tax=Caldimonas tepidiphila TaxID=2315841 RepID=UPI000E5C24E9|nr:hypothetical protein [Caldimonas tepidiphila]
MSRHADERHLLTPGEVVLTLGIFAHSPPQFATDEGIEIARRTFTQFIAAAEEGGFGEAGLLAGLLSERRLSARTLRLAESAVRAAGDKGRRIFTALERLGDGDRPLPLH